MSDTFTMIRRVQFAETDQAGVLHFSNYFRWMEEIEHAFWRSHELSVILRASGEEISWPRVRTGCEYLAPARFEDELSLSFVVAEVGKRSVTYNVEFCRGDQLVARGTTKAVCCAMHDGAFSAVEMPHVCRSILLGAVAKDS